MIAASADQTPRNRKQAYNMKQYKHAGLTSLGDHLSDILGSLLSTTNDEKKGGIQIICSLEASKPTQPPLLGAGDSNPVPKPGDVLHLSICI